MEKMKTEVTDFKIAWNNFGVNTTCPICGDRTDPSINFQVQTQGGDAICEECVITEATELAEVLYAYFAHKHPEDKMTKLFLARIKEEKALKNLTPKLLHFNELETLCETIDAVKLRAYTAKGKKGSIGHTKMYLVTKKWYRVNVQIQPGHEMHEALYDDEMYKALYEKALKEGAVIAESKL